MTAYKYICYKYILKIYKYDIGTFINQSSGTFYLIGVLKLVFLYGTQRAPNYQYMLLTIVLDLNWWLPSGLSRRSFHCSLNIVFKSDVRCKRVFMYSTFLWIGLILKYASSTLFLTFEGNFYVSGYFPEGGAGSRESSSQQRPLCGNREGNHTNTSKTIYSYVT